MMTPMSPLETQMSTLEGIYSQTFQIPNPKTGEKEEYSLMQALPIAIRYAEELRKTITNCMNKNLELAKKEKGKKLSSKDYQTAIKETNAYQSRIKEYEALAGIFNKQKENFCGNLTAAKMVKNLSSEELTQISKKEKDLEQITTLITNFLKIADGQNKKSLLRNDLNWLGQVIVREGNYPGNAKYCLWSTYGADKFHFPIPKELKKAIQGAIENWNIENPIEKMNVTRKLAEEISEVANQLRDTAHLNSSLI